MKSIFAIWTVVLCLLSCKPEKENMHVAGEIAGLKKGTLYLQRMENSMLITLDSAIIDGDSRFAFSVPLESPEVFYLYLDKDDKNPLNDRLLFFGEAGEITIKTTRDFFEMEAQVIGSATHKKWEEYEKNRSKFNDIRLNLIKASIEAQRENRIKEADSIQKLLDKNTMRSYLYALNFAFNNKDSYVAPYVVLSETYDVKPTYLDTIYQSLTPQVARSKYGKLLGDYIKKVKTAEVNK